MRRLLILLPLLAQPAAGQEIPPCAAPRAGAVACLSGKLCRCDYARGGSVSGRVEGWRWDCGVLRPSCGPLPPPDGGVAPMPLPELMLSLPPPRRAP